MYVIETRMAAEPPNQTVAVRAAVLSHTTVTTLDEARTAAVSWVSALGDGAHEPIRAAESLPETGGTVGPLPDGTVIEVRPA